MNRAFNYSLAFLLGIVAGVSTVYVLPSTFEVVVWLLVIVLLAYASNRFWQKNIFQETFTLSIFSGVGTTITHLLFIHDYLQSHEEEIATLNSFKINDSHSLTLLLLAPLYWVILGVLAAITAVFFKSIMKKKK